MIKYGDRYDFDRWAADNDNWDHETGAPGILLFADAVQVWSFLQLSVGGTSVADAARAFNIDPLRVIEAVEAHAWMFLSGPRDDFTKLIIEHDGE